MPWPRPKPAIEEGIVPGGGVALLRSLAVLDKLEKSVDYEDEKLGLKILKKALMQPLWWIAH